MEDCIYHVGKIIFCCESLTALTFSPVKKNPTPNRGRCANPVLPVSLLHPNNVTQTSMDNSVKTKWNA